MQNLAEVITAVQQIANDASKLGQGASSTAETLRKKAQKLSMVSKPSKSGAAAAQQVSSAAKSLANCSMAMSALQKAAGDFIKDASK
jgi:hypothetical protein